MSNHQVLVENIAPSEANLVIEATDVGNNKRNWFMEGIFIQGEKRNHNGRVYPKTEIIRAVENVQQRINQGLPILGEVDHPANLNINLDRVSHVIENMRVDGSNGIGKLRILPTEPGKLIQTFLECGIKLGVSSRGAGEVDHNGNVKNFNIVTVDIVATPSAPDAFPQPVLEALQNWKRWEEINNLVKAKEYDPRAQKFLKEEVIKFLNGLNKQ